MCVGKGFGHDYGGVQASVFRLDSGNKFNQIATTLEYSTTFIISSRLCTQEGLRGSKEQQCLHLHSCYYDAKILNFAVFKLADTHAVVRRKKGGLHSFVLVDTVFST